MRTGFHIGSNITISLQTFFVCFLPLCYSLSSLSALSLSSYHSLLLLCLFSLSLLLGQHFSHCVWTNVFLKDPEKHNLIICQNKTPGLGRNSIPDQHISIEPVSDRTGSIRVFSTHYIALSAKLSDSSDPNSK